MLTTFLSCTGRTCRKRAARRLPAWPRNKLRAEPGHRFEQPVLRARCLCRGRARAIPPPPPVPLVQGIGKHTSNMGRLALVPCCGREWYLHRYLVPPTRGNSNVSRRWRSGARSPTRCRRGDGVLVPVQITARLAYADRPRWRRGGVDGRRHRRYGTRSGRRPTDEELAKFGLAYDPRRPYHPVVVPCQMSPLDGVAPRWPTHLSSPSRLASMACAVASMASVDTRRAAAAPTPVDVHAQVKVKKSASRGKVQHGRPRGDGGHGQRDATSFESEGLRELARRKEGGIFREDRSQLGGT